MTAQRRPDDAAYRSAKLALADQARRDKRLDAYERVVCAEIISRAWKATGCTDSGRETIGRIEQDGAEFTAIAGDCRLGVFPNLKAAADALSDGARAA